MVRFMFFSYEIVFCQPIFQIQSYPDAALRCCQKLYTASKSTIIVATTAEPETTVEPACWTLIP